MKLQTLLNTIDIMQRINLVKRNDYYHYTTITLNKRLCDIAEEDIIDYRFYRVIDIYTSNDIINITIVKE